MESKAFEVAALGRPLFPGMLYDCRTDSFIPGVTLWDKKSLSEDLDSHPQLLTDLKFSSSDSLSSKSSLLDVSASLKASFLGGLVEVGGSAKYLCDTKSSNQQSRVTMYYSETSRFDQLTMTQLGKITYPQVFDQKTATHVVTAVLYGAQAFMVFDQMSSKDEKKQEIEGRLHVMVRKLPGFSIEGEGSVNMTEDEKKIAENITCIFHGDFHLEQNPTTYTEALNLYKRLPTVLKENPQNAVPLKVWLYPLHLLDIKAAKLEREISTNLVSNTEDIMEELGEVQRTCNDLSRITMVNAFSDLEDRLHSFQDSFSIYKTVLQKALARVLPAIRGGGEEQQSLEDILKIHYSSPFNADKLNQWLHDAKSELHLLNSQTKTLEQIRIEDSDGLNTILLDPDIDAVVCLTFTSLKYEDPYLSTLKEFLTSDMFKELDGNKMLFVASGRKWFNTPDVIKKMRENLSRFRGFSEANKDEKRINFIISAVSDPSNPGSSIYLYENANLTDAQFEPVSKPSPPIVKNVLDQTVSLKLQKSPSGVTVQYRVEYKELKADSGAEEGKEWLVINTDHDDFILTELESGKQYMIRYRIVGKVGVSEASDTVSTIPSSAQDVIVGGKGGDEFSFKSFSSSIWKISITFSKMTLNTIQVIFNTGHMVKVGNSAGSKEQTFQLDENEKIVAATLWPNYCLNRCGGLEFVIAKNGSERMLSVKCDALGEPVRVHVKSGKCYGIKGRSGDEIDALGFYFI
ncbi:stonustoxin subunit alpha-like [Sinocyclocheilus anshuiensis]|uniref:stonustoxin subunit alpha-like n=1 Tax=Sinocyclocheilus anshuiensis TaxID=1608454 RepID=UPI0007BA675F|nr:PREDICTED: stonustoxin subunit alpha-like [Sinocyclocheilus anshuiensis]